MPDLRFHDLLAEIGKLHDKKQQDYGKDEDPLANVRASEDFGVPAWIGALIRLNDKVHRLKRFAQRGDLANESAEDSMMDIAVYALLALILYRELPGIKTALLSPSRDEWLTAVSKWRTLGEAKERLKQQMSDRASQRHDPRYAEYEDFGDRAFRGRRTREGG